MKMQMQAAKTKTAYWTRNPTGNRALGTLYSGINDLLLALNVTISEARLKWPEYEIYEKRP